MKKSLYPQRSLLVAVVLSLVWASAGKSLADVNVFPATNGINSADLAQNGAAPAWTTLTNTLLDSFGIQETGTPAGRGDFAAQTNTTLILTAPDGWQFNAGAGTVSYKADRDITAATISVTTSNITITLTVGDTNHQDQLYIEGIQVQAIEGGDLPAAGDILRTSANPGTATITGIVNDTTSFGALSQIIGDLRLYVALPGQTFTDATNVAASGISGSPTEQAVGASFDLASLVVADRQYNIDGSYSGATNISYSGPGNGSTLNPSYTTNVSFTAGTSTTTLATTLGKAETVAITATDGTIAGVASSSLTVNKGSQTITFDPLAGKTYGDTPFEVDATASTGLPVSFSIYSGPATVLEDMVTITGAGDVTVRASQAGDSDWNEAAPVDQSFNVAKVTVTGAVAADNKVYDGNTSAVITNWSLTGVIGLDVVVLTNETADFADKNVGTGKTVITTNLMLTGSEAGNYTLASTSATNIADITARTLTVSATGVNKVYDGTTNATVILSDDRADGDNLTNNYTEASFADANVDTGKPVSVTGITVTGPDSGNYTYNTDASATADITALDITGDFTADNKVYDGTTNATVLTRTLSGVLAGDVGNVTLDGGTASFADANAGVGKTVTLIGASLGGPASDNYNLTSVDTATADIAQFLATVTLDNLSQIYDGTARPATASTTPSGLTVDLTYDGSTNAPTNAGTYQVIGTINETNYLGSATNNLVISLAVSPASLPNAIKNTTYANLATIIASGGVAPYTFGVGAGFPAGLTLNDTNGLIKGKPTTLGSYTFTITATDANSRTGMQDYTMLVSASGDVTTPPVVTIKSPLPNGTLYGSSVVVTGLVSDASGATNVQVSVNDGPFVNATLFSGPVTATPWSYDAGALPAATNKVAVRATDLLGNITTGTQIKTNTFFYSVLQSLTIITNNQGNCTIKATDTTYGTPTHGASLVIGRPYKFKVTPTAGFIYSNTVVSSDAGVSNYSSTTVGFTMQSNTVITVNAPTNWYLATTGTYYGLFSSNSGVDIKSAGYFKLKVKAKGNALPTFSINVQVDGEQVGGSGSFTVANTGSLKKPILRKRSGQANLLVSLALDAGNQQVTGTVTTVSNDWTADLLGDRVIWTAASPATNYDGQYTLVVTGAVGSGSSPGGDGYGTVKLDTNGVIKLTGNQGEGQAMSQKTGLSKDGLWPLYVRGTKDGTKIYKSMIMGWVTVSPEPARDLSGTVSWIKQGGSGSLLYPGGFTNEVELLGSEYSVPDVNELAIQLAPSGLNGLGQLTLDNETVGMGGAVTVTNIVLSPMPTNSFTVLPNPVTLKLKKPLYKVGVMKGDFIHPGTGAKTAIIGVILQDANVARGMFKSGGESGSFLLEAQP